MASSSSFVITREEFNLFHKIDRELYTILAINLWRDPLDSLRIMALWIWLEQMGFKNVVKKILSLPLILVNELADEAATCLNCINNNNNNNNPQIPIPLLSENSDIPLTQTLMEKEISLQFFHENLLLATQGITKVVKEVCVRAFSDITTLAIERNDGAQNLAQNQVNIRMSPNPPIHQMSPNSPTHQTVVNQSFRNNMAHGSTSGNVVHQPYTRGHEITPPDDRTMFVTFSKGYPVFEWELREFFTRAYGDCVQYLHMQEVEPNQQSLYARIVFRSASTIQMILKGNGKVKFNINGKHVWARKFVPKHSRPSQPPAPLLLPPPPS